MIDKTLYKKLNILVVGDSCVDRFTYGKVTRLAPEAPIPIINPLYYTENNGMAGNVVDNIRAIGAGVQLLTNKETILKNRFVDERSNQILIRVDENDKVKRIDKLDLLSLNNNVYNGTKVDAIIISDYDKGFLDEEDIEYICNNNKNVFIDTKKILDTWCSEASFIKINHVEYERTEFNIKDLNLEDKLIITKSSDGCKYNGVEYPVEKVQIKDVSGAGDTFISSLVLEYVRTKNIIESIIFAQKCATIVVQKKGVTTI
jgi:D-beta-D-heptose 7-phosphate kinase/D-beta-D-heptose 1-phosphate adenosyltransferase